jgi:hypothetical protein
MAPEVSSVRMRLSPAKSIRTQQTPTTAEPGSCVATATMPIATREGDAPAQGDGYAHDPEPTAGPSRDIVPAVAHHSGAHETTGMSDLAVRLQAFELGDLFRYGDLAALREMTPAQLRAQVTARERLHRHAQRVLNLAEAGRPGNARERAAAAGVVDLLGLLCEHARGEQPQPAVTGPRLRRPLTAPTHLWADTTAPTTTPAPDDAATVGSGSMICASCGLPLERSDLAAALGRPSSQGWRHVDGRKTHFPTPVPKPGARRTPHASDSAAA